MTDTFVLCYYDYLINSRGIYSTADIIRKWPDLEDSLHYFCKGTGRKVGNIYDFIAYFKERYIKK